MRTARDLAASLAGAPGAGWARGIGYDESVAGDLDRAALDRLAIGRPVRVQHRSGSLWVLNSAGLDIVGQGAPADGRLWRQDRWLRDRLGPSALPDLGPLGAALAAAGVTGVTDATPGSAVALAAAGRAIPQRLVSLGEVTGTGLAAGPRKIALSGHQLPSYAALLSAVRRTHEVGRAVAAHTVTRHSLLLFLAVLGEAGVLPGDRLEHAAVVPPETLEPLAALGLPVITQPSLIARRGDDYLDRVEASDLGSLWRFATLRDAGVPVACSSDAPYGDLDPWLSVRAAHDRLTPSSRVLGGTERVSAAAALDGYLTPLEAPGAAPRRVAVDTPADLVLLDAPLPAVLDDPNSGHVTRTMIAGRTAFTR